jgi:hypothetical protein
MKFVQSQLALATNDLVHRYWRMPYERAVGG